MTSSALHVAARNMAIEEARSLIANGADVNAIDGMSRTPLHIACWRGDSDMVKLLLRSKASTSMKAKDHFTALHFAVQSGSLECCMLLLEQNKNLCNMRISKGNKTPLHMAAAKGEIDIVRFLLEAGSDPTALTNKKQTALDFAAVDSVIYHLLRSHIDAKITSISQKRPTKSNLSTSDTDHMGDSLLSKKRAAPSTEDTEQTHTAADAGSVPSHPLPHGTTPIETICSSSDISSATIGAVTACRNAGGGEGGTEALGGAAAPSSVSGRGGDSEHSLRIVIDTSKRKKKRAKVAVHMSHLYADDDEEDM